MDGRFYVKENGDKPLLVGVAIGDLLKVGHVYQIDECLGVIQLKDLGESAIVGDDADNASVDKLLANGGGRHCVIDDR
jgi:hypothetical protein